MYIHTHTHIYICSWEFFRKFEERFLNCLCFLECLAFLFWKQLVFLFKICVLSWLWCQSELLPQDWVGPYSTILLQKRSQWWNESWAHWVSSPQLLLQSTIKPFNVEWSQRRQWQPTPVFLPGESQGRGSLVGCHLWGCTESDTTEAT